jgi:VanZ family protein
MFEPRITENVNLTTEFVEPIPGPGPGLFWLWLPTILWSVMLCVFSTEPFGAAHTYQAIGTVKSHLPLLLGFIDPHLLNVIARKGAHFTIYIGYFLVLATGPMRTRPWLALLICMIAGTCDEVHQIFVPGRTPSLYDVGIDTSGAIFGRFFYYGFLQKA